MSNSQDTADKSKNRRALAIVATGIAGVGVLALGAVFMMSSSDNEPEESANQIILPDRPSAPAEISTREGQRQEQPAAEAAAPAPAAPAQQTRTPEPVQPAPRVADTVAKQEALDLAVKSRMILKSPESTIATLLIDGNGQEVDAGSDFDTHVSLFNRGGVSVLVAAGPHAGTRVGFFPVENVYNRQGPVITIERLADSKGLLPESKRSLLVIPMKTPPQPAAEDTVLPADARTTQKNMHNGTKEVTAVEVKGTPEKDGIFSVKIWNGDSYAIDLNTGSYTLRTTFMNQPDWQPGQAATRNKVRGRFDMPAPAQNINFTPR